MIPVLLALIGIPILELAVALQIGGRIGAWPTVALILLTALLGMALVRAQGFAVAGRVRSQLEQGAFPALPLFDGACLLLAGMLLIVPGFVTDLAGFLLLIPPLRRMLAVRLIRHLEAREAPTTHTAGKGPRADSPPSNRDPSGPVIEGDWREIDPETAPPQGGRAVDPPAREPDEDGSTTEDPPERRR